MPSRPALLRSLAPHLLIGLVVLGIGVLCPGPLLASDGPDETPPGTAQGSAPSSRLAEAGQALERGELATAETAFEQARDTDPGSPLPWLGLAEIDERRGRLLEALEKTGRAEKLLGHSGASPELEGHLLELRSRLQVRLGAVAEALGTLERWRTRFPGASRPYLLAALVLRDVEQLGPAIDLLRQARVQGAGSREIDEQLGLLLLASGSEDGAAEARRLAEAALREHPDDGGLALVLGLALAADPEARNGAADWLEKALELGVPDPGRVHLELGRLLAEQASDDPASGTEAGCDSPSVDHFRRAVELHPELAQAHYRLGNALRACGDRDGALAALSRFRQLNQEGESADHRRRSIGAALNDVQRMAAEGRPIAALETLDTLAAEAPDDPRVFLLRSKILFSADRKEEAVASIRRARQLSPDRVEAHYLEGLFLAQLGRLDEAEAALRHGLAIDPAQADAHSLLAAVLADRGRLEDAADHFQQALLHGAEGAPLRLGYAEVLRKLGREEESQRQVELYRLHAEQ